MSKLAECRAQNPSACVNRNCPERRAYLSAMDAFVEEVQKSHRTTASTLLNGVKKYDVDTTKSNHFGFRRTIIEAFTNADCWRLANYLHKRTGWDIVAIGELRDASANPADRYWYHMVCALPRAKYLTSLVCMKR